ncbi:MAG TPA: sigma 54-interacting transcriptional regulator [Blastocatellia bacterium]|nr:sigma 54-interacting transcriptional regulator [Blastocatellia bacterium]
MNKTKVLVVDDDPMMLDLARYQLQSRGYEVTTAETGEEALKLNADQRCDIVLTDLQLPDIDGIELVRQLKEAAPGTEILMVTGYGSVNGAIEATKAGAFYFIEKPVEFEELFVLMEKALERSRQAEEIRQLRDRWRYKDSYYNIIGSSKAMQNIYEIIESVSESDANIMIVGESGTGKELIANAIHYRSLRSKKPFVKINCSALPKELIESELFGHTKGAFTGATTDKQGLIGQAAGGSLLLDEIGEMPIELQPKLLRVLQERVYYRLGSEKALEADFRLISATNRNPLDAVSEGQLREDLYYRINTIEIHVPPLRERAEDVQHLAEHFLRVYAEKYHRPVHAISQQAYERMFAYSWPGNVRELQNVMERAVLLSKGEVIEEQAMPYAQTAKVTFATTPAGSARPQAAPAGPAAAATAPPLNAQDLTLEQIARLIVNRMPDPKSGGPRVDIFTQLEGAIVSAALERTRGNKQAAANLLGLYRPRLYSMLRKHNLHDTIREVEPAAPPQSAAGDGAAEPEAAVQDESRAAAAEPEVEQPAVPERSPQGPDPMARRSMESARFHG